MITLTKEEIDSRKGLMKVSRVPMATNRWHEGVELIGYWPEGDSVVLRGDGHYFCITKGFLLALARDNPEQNDPLGMRQP